LIERWHCPEIARMRPQLLHLSGPLRGRTETYGEAPLTVGSAADDGLRLRHDAVAPHHARITYSEDDCSFHLHALEGAVFVNRQEVHEVILHEDDLIEWGIGGPRSRFRAYVPPGRVCKPIRRMLSDAGEVRRASGGTVAAQGLARDLLTQATPQLKVGVPLLVLAIALPLAYVAGWLGARTGGGVRGAHEVALQEIEELRREQREQRAELQRMAAANAVLARIQGEWSRSVCLIHGVFGMQQADGSWVAGVDGRLLRSEYTGSGFLANADGYVLTNRHVMRPWETDPGSEAAVRLGARPTFQRLTATFPGLGPVEVDAASCTFASDDLDVACFRVPREAVASVPVAPLHEGPIEDLADRRAIVVGYPTGLLALLAKAPPAVAEELRVQRADMARVIDRLAKEDLIRPTITQGVIGNIESNMLVYDASTTHGGSGGPVFGGDGTVIAVNFAILRQFSGANFGVPIRYGKDLLPR
jgi:serine protease Do